MSEKEKNDFDLPNEPLTEEEEKIENKQKLKEKNRALFCSFCGKPKHDHWVGNMEDGKFKKNQFGNIDLYRRLCPEELENNLAYYYDDILKNHVGVRPATSPLQQLFSINAELRRGFISHAFIIGSLRKNFPAHLKCFIKFVTQDNKAKKFKYKFLDFTELRELKFGKDQDYSYSKLDEYPILIFDLEKEAHDNKADQNNLLELVVHREARNKALWFISPSDKIQNKHLTDMEICSRIYAYKQIDLRTQLEKQQAPHHHIASAPQMPSPALAGASGVDVEAQKRAAMSYLARSPEKKED